MTTTCSSKLLFFFFPFVVFKQVVMTTFWTEFFLLLPTGKTQLSAPQRCFFDNMLATIFVLFFSMKGGGVGGGAQVRRLRPVIGKQTRERFLFLFFFCLRDSKLKRFSFYYVECLKGSVFGWPWKVPFLSIASSFDLFSYFFLLKFILLQKMIIYSVCTS